MSSWRSLISFIPRTKSPREFKWKDARWMCQWMESLFRHGLLTRGDVFAKSRLPIYPPTPHQTRYGWFDAFLKSWPLLTKNKNQNRRGEKKLFGKIYFQIVQPWNFPVRKKGRKNKRGKKARRIFFQWWDDFFF